MTTIRDAAPAPARSRAAFALLLVLSFAAFAAAVTLAYRYASYRRTMTGAARAQLVSTTGAAAADIDAIVRSAVSAADAIADPLSSGALAGDALRARMQATAAASVRFYGVCVSYKPFAFDPKRRLYSLYFAKKGGRLQFVQLDQVYDYTSPEYEWFTPVVEDGPRWTQPYYDAAAATTMITYSRPFSRIDPATGARTPIGTVSVDLSMDGIRDIIDSLDLGPSGFGALVSQKGVYLYHPDTELVQARRTLEEVARAQNDRDRLALAAKVSQRASGILDHRSLTTGLAAWLVYAPVPSTGWSLQNTFVVGDLPLDVDRLRRELIQLIVALLVFGVAAAALLSGAQTGRTANLWVASSAAAVLVAIAIGAVWYVALAYDARSRGAGVRISDRATLGRVQQGYVRTCAARHTEPPVYVPTGLFIEAAHFGAPDDLAVSGYLWQKYTVGAHDTLSRGFTIGGASDLAVAENYRTTEGGVEIVRWHFACTVRQALDHRRYPLEQGTISLRILHRDLDHNVVLVPDLAAYRFANPSALPGVEKELAIPGWRLGQSFFEFRNKRYDSDFGIERSFAREAFPSLYFSIVMQRNFVDAFISNLTALIIVAVLLFTLLMLGVRDERLVGYMQAGSGRILSICAAMFFVIAFSHVDIRRKIAAEEVFYLEYFYLLIYVSILWVSVNSVLFAMNARIALIQHRDNLISKLLFWPVLLLMLFATTVSTFY